MNETVFLVEDDAAVRLGICDLLESAHISSQSFASAEEFLQAWNTDMMGCLLLDVRLPGISGLELQSQLIARGVSLPIIIMTAHGDIPMVRKVLKAGAVEFLTKPFHDHELLEAVEQAFKLHRESRERGSAVQSIQERILTLSERERQVLELVTTGLTNKEIGAQLHLSVVTIKLYRGQLMRKMQASTFAELVKMWQHVRAVSRSTDDQTHIRNA
ncbi:MAG TPA: response regulator [Terracidiphilus sp.]